MHHDDAAVGENKSGGYAQMIGEERELVRAAIAIGIFADLDSVVALPWRLHVIRVVNGLSNPKAATFVPGYADWLSNIGFGRKKAHGKIRMGDEMLHGFLREQRFLHGLYGITLGSPFRPRHIIGQRDRGIHVFKGSQP